MNDIHKHIKTHTDFAQQDQRAIATIQYRLSKSKNFKCYLTENDKTPNTDGRLEFIVDPHKDKRPFRSLCVQAKSTNVVNKLKNGEYSYTLDDLAFPAYMLERITSDFGILFIVSNINSESDDEVIFWVCMTPHILHDIDFSQSSKTIRLTEDNIITNIDSFATALLEQIKIYDTAKKLDDLVCSSKFIDEKILQCDKYICEKIEQFDCLGRDKISQDIITRLKLLCEMVMKKCTGQPRTTVAYEYILTKREWGFLGKFLRNLTYSNIVIPDDGEAERLMLKYYDYLWEMRELLSNNYGMHILPNLEKFPVDLSVKENEVFYAKIADLFSAKNNTDCSFQMEQFYIQRKKKFYIKGKRYFEIELQLANVHATKYDRVTVYSDLDISDYYAVQIKSEFKYIEMWNYKIPIRVAIDYRVSIVPAALNGFSAVFGDTTKMRTDFIEYKSLMSFLTITGMNLVNLIDMSDEQYSQMMSKIYEKTPTIYYKNIIDKAREIANIKKHKNGWNVIRYLLFGMNENIINLQLASEKNSLLSNLYITTKSIGFDRTPLSFSLLGHNPQLKDLLQCISRKNRDDEMLARAIINNTEKNNGLYSDVSSIHIQGDIQKLIRSYNYKIWEKQRDDNRIILMNDLLYISGYEKTCVEILRRLMMFTHGGIKGYNNAISSWIKEHNKEIDCDDKKSQLLNMFDTSHIALIYGSAGTGKTTLMNHISNYFQSRNKYFLANTRTAVNNLIKRIDSPGSIDRIMTVNKFLHKRGDVEMDILFIDECGTLSNREFLKILNKAKTTLLILVGDIYQLESIQFGNWFKLAKSIMPQHSVNELTTPWRARDNADLIRLWNEVRSVGENISEELAFSQEKYSYYLDESIIKHDHDDEIILAHNYDGLFGINNINRYLQLSNPNSPVEWHMWTYKIGDPILFNESTRFPSLYNNLKGKIVDINVLDCGICFDVEVDIPLTEFDLVDDECEFISAENGRTVVRIIVYDNLTAAYDVQEQNDDLAKRRIVVPFQIAYATSIYKSQGLEYDYVKVILPNELSDQIDHNTFYTAITRAKKNLKIYWSPETQQKIISSFKNNEDTRDKRIIQEILQRIE